MAIPIEPSPDVTFTNPLGHLRGCHDRIARDLGVVMRVAARHPGSALHLNDREALASALRYFREEAPNHIEDEEESLFPRLKASKSRSAIAARAPLDRLEQEHRMSDPLQAELDLLIDRWLTAGTLSADEVKRLETLGQELQGFYERHFRVEDREAFSPAAVALTASQMIEIGREMALRRGLNPDLATAYPMDNPAR